MKHSKPTLRKGFNVNNSYEAEPLETKLMRMIENGEPLGQETPLI